MANILLVGRMMSWSSYWVLFNTISPTRKERDMIWSQLKRKRYEIVPYSGVYTMPYSNQSSRRTVFISYRIQVIFMPVSRRRKANPVFFHTVFVSYQHRVNGVLKAFDDYL